MSARITQETIESLQIPGTQHARITQQVVEALNIPERTVVTSSARVTQQAIEFLYIVGLNPSRTGMISFAYPVIAQVGVQ